MKNLIILITLLCTFIPYSHAGSKKLMSISAAKLVAERAIAESVMGLKIKSNESVESMVGRSVEIESKMGGEIKGIEYTRIVYDPEKDIAQVTAALTARRIKTILGGSVDYRGLTISRTGFASSTPTMTGPIKALRAAELDAYRQLAKKVVGFELSSHTLVKDFLLENDDINAQVAAALYGAEVVSTKWDGEDAFLIVSINVKQVEDIFGQSLNYDEEFVTAEGSGTAVDDRQQAQQPDQLSARSTNRAPTAQAVEQRIDFGGSAGNAEVEQQSIGGGMAHSYE